MKKAINFSALAILLTVSLSVLAGRVVSNPQVAAESYKPFQQAVAQLRAEGFSVTNVQENPVMYLMAPEGDHFWGNISYTLTRKVGENSLITEYVVLSVELDWIARKNGYKAVRLLDNRTTVY